MLPVGIQPYIILSSYCFNYRFYSAVADRLKEYLHAELKIKRKLTDKQMLNISYISC